MKYSTIPTVLKKFRLYYFKIMVSLILIYIYETTFRVVSSLQAMSFHFFESRVDQKPLAYKNKVGLNISEMQHSSTIV